MAAHQKKPCWFTPMLATLVKEPFSDTEWLFEVKFDGYRALSFLDGENVEIYSRNHNSFNKFYPTIVQALEKLDIDAIFDGEIVSLDEKGISRFELLKNYQSEPLGDLCYYIFDLPYYNGRDLRDEPLIERKALLKKILPRSKILRYSDHILGEGEKLYREAEKKKMEGIMAKRVDSPYLSRRSQEWLKVKIPVTEKVVIAGFTEPKGSRQKFGALLLGVYEKKKLRYIGHVGTGFTEEDLQEIYKKLKPLIQEKCPFTPEPKVNATWVKPKLKCTVTFTEWTNYGKLRQPVFHGLD